MKKNNIHVFIIGVAVGIIIFQIISFMRIQKIESQDVLFKVQITAAYINVRSQPTSAANKIYEVNREEQYEVISYFDEDTTYNWYKIIFSDRRIGWIASEKENPWVMEVK